MKAISVVDQVRRNKFAKNEAKKLLALIAEASFNNRVSRARRLQYIYFRSSSAKLYAASQACRKLKLARPVFAQDIADQLDVFQPCYERPAYFDRIKPSGDTRTIFVFSPLSVARQILVLDVLKATSPLPDWQYNTTGRGRDAAITRALEAIRAGYRHFCCIDIQNCYESFDGERIAAILPLPRKVTRHVIMADNLAPPDAGSAGAFCSPRIRMVQDRHVLQPRRPAIFPQGSVASNYAASLVLSDLADILPPRTVPIMFGDDLLVLARSKRVANEIAKTLRDALERHRAGCLRLKRCDHGDLRRTECRFLGYVISAPNGEPYVNITDKNELKLMHKLRSAISNDTRNNDAEITQTVKVLESASRSFRHWSGLVEFCRDQLDIAHYQVLEWAPQFSDECEVSDA